MSAKHIFLWTLIVSLCLAAVAGVVAILFHGLYGHAGDHVIGTLLTVSLFSLTALGASVVLERGLWRRVMMVALGVSGLGLVFYLAVIWGVLRWRHARGTYEDWIWKAMWLLGVWAVALPHAGLLSLARLAQGPWRWARLAALMAVFLLAGVLSVAVVFEIGERPMIRCIGVLGILTALGTIAVPVLSKIHRIGKMQRVESTPLELKITCPRCLLEQTVDSGHSRCARCRLKFHIDIEEPECPACGYLLHRLTKPRCPECGVALADQEIAPAPDAAHEGR